MSFRFAQIAARQRGLLTCILSSTPYRPEPHPAISVAVGSKTQALSAMLVLPYPKRYRSTRQNPGESGDTPTGDLMAWSFVALLPTVAE